MPYSGYGPHVASVDGLATDDEQTVSLRVSIPLSVPWVVEQDVVGSSWPISVGDFEGTLRLPKLESEKKSVLVAPPGFARVSDAYSGIWGRTEGGLENERQWRIDAIAFVFEVRSSVSIAIENLPEHSVTVPFGADLHAWIGRFGVWARAWLGQLLDPMHPSPRQLNPPGSVQFSWGVIGGTESLVNSSPPPMTITVEQDTNVLSELSICGDSMDRLTRQASDTLSKPPVALELLALGRQAAQRGLLRQSIIELGTAAETLLRPKLGVEPSERKTLGMLIELANDDDPLPSDIKPMLLHPRNAAIHSGRQPTRSEVVRAAEIVQQLLDSELPHWARPSEARRAHRSQRMDISIVQA